MSLEVEKSDEELLNQYQLERNPSILNTILTRHIDIGFRTAMRYMGNQSDAEDVLQNAIIQFLKNLHLFREGAITVKPWLMKMIINTSLNHLKEEKRRSNRQQAVASEKFENFENVQDQVEQVTEAQDLKIKIKKLVDDLPEKYRSPIWLVLYEGFSYPEVATVLELPEKTIRTQVVRGLERLKNMLGSSVLSVEAVVLLITKSPLEKAPASTMKIIQAKEIYQHATNITAQSGKILITQNPSILFSFKFILTFIVVSVASIVSCFYYTYNKEFLSEKELNIPSKNAKILVETNRIWDFTKVEDRDLKVLLGSWEYSASLKGMVPPFESSIMFSLPIVSQEKAFILESLVTPMYSKSIPNAGLYFTASWVEGSAILSHEHFEIPQNYIVDKQKELTIKVYFYKNYVCLFVNDLCIRINKITEELTEASPLIVSKNYSFQKIESRTLPTPPDELLKAISGISGLTSEVKRRWQINPETFEIKKDN